MREWYRVSLLLCGVALLWGLPAQNRADEPENLMIFLRMQESQQQRSQTSGTHYQTRRQPSAFLQIRALEGYPAQINDAEWIPVLSGSLWGTGIDYAALGTRLSVTARLQGDTVIAEVEATDRSGDSARISGSSLRTSVSGRTGDWILLGTTGIQHSASQSNGGGRRYSTSDSTTRWELKIEPID